MSDETATEISPPTDDDDLTYKFQIAIKVEPFLCCGDGEPESAMTRLSGDIQELDEDCEPDEVVGHVEFCIADFRDESPSWVLDGRMEDAKFINLFGDSPMIQSITDVPDYAVGAGCEFAALKSYPLQHELKGDKPSEFDQLMALGALEADAAKAKKSLAKYYRSAGFKPVAGTDGLMVKNLGM